jgi:hypothetical protein
MISRRTKDRCSSVIWVACATRADQAKADARAEALRRSLLNLKDVQRRRRVLRVRAAMAASPVFAALWLGFLWVCRDHLHTCSFGFGPACSGGAPR